MHIHQLILHGCSNALHLEMDFDPGGSVVATRTSGGPFTQRMPSALEVMAEDSYWSLRMLRGNDWNREAMRHSLSAIARTHPKGQPQLLKRQGHLTLLDLEQVFFDPTTLEFEDMEVFFAQDLDYFLHSLEEASQIGLATAVQADPQAQMLYKDTRLIYRDGRSGVWYVVFWGIAPAFEQALLPQTSSKPEMPPMMAPFLASFF